MSPKHNKFFGKYKFKKDRRFHESTFFMKNEGTKNTCAPKFAFLDDNEIHNLNVWVRENHSDSSN